MLATLCLNPLSLCLPPPQGLLDLHGATGDVAHLHWALQLQAKMDECLWDEQGGGYFNNASGDASILLRMKEARKASERVLASFWGLLVCMQAVHPSFSRAA